MTIHAAKGLEFPVVFVADLAHESRSPESKTFLAESGYGYALQIFNEKTQEKVKPFKTEHYRGGGSSINFFENGERVGNFGGSGGADTDGARLQSTGGSVGGWSTDTVPPDRQQNVAQQPAAAGAGL